MAQTNCNSGAEKMEEKRPDLQHNIKLCPFVGQELLKFFGKKPRICSQGKVFHWNFSIAAFFMRT
jgi:hypothetical protein